MGNFITLWFWYSQTLFDGLIKFLNFPAFWKNEVLLNARGFNLFLLFIYKSVTGADSVDAGGSGYAQPRRGVRLGEMLMFSLLPLKTVVKPDG